MTSGDLEAIDTVRLVVSGLLAAIAGRDMAAVAGTLSPDVRWSNVPHPAAVGREAVVDMLAAVIERCDRVRWDVVASAYAGDRAHLERVDRFWIDGTEYAAECHGVFVVDTRSRQVTTVRDYVDLGEWRSRLAPANRSNLPHD